MRPLIATASILLLSLAGQIDARPQSTLTSLFDVEQNETPTCGYASCPKTDPTKINVHVVAHTHDDVGWLKTVDQYYYGTSNMYARVGVEHILDSLIPVLVMDKTKRFVYVEMSFFSKWWTDQDARMRSVVRQLVNEGRLEFINGGWCMNDEATVTYHSTIEQMTLGLRFLNETFGQCARPKVGWQIDPFGHSSEQASLFAQFGFDGMYFVRIGYMDKLARKRSKSLDLIWHGDRALPGQSGSIFTNVFYDHYELGLYCFDVQCKDDSVVDNENSYEYNADRYGWTLIQYARTYAVSKMTNNILIPFGGDFHFSAASQNFKSFDRLIRFVRAQAKDINIFYSTPSCYQYAVNEALQAAKNISLPEKYDDFMPYDSSATVWWSGYFASRPSTKLIERETAQLLQVVRMVSLSSLIHKLIGHNAQTTPQINWLKEVEAQERECLMPLWEILGDLQHHDAVTGTEKQHVTDDYQRRVSDANHRCARMMTRIKRKQLEEKLKKSPKFEQLKHAAAKIQLDPIFLEETVFCRSLNISQCEPNESEVDVSRYLHLKLVKSHLAHAQAHHQASNLSHSVPVPSVPLPRELETKAVLLTVYNPLARLARHVDIRLPCNGNCDLDKVQVIHLATNETQKLVRLPVLQGIAKLPFRDSRTTSEILFYADVPALGSASFVIGDDNPVQIVDEEVLDDAFVITDETLRQNKQNVIRGRRMQRDSSGGNDDESDGHFEYFTMAAGSSDEDFKLNGRTRRDAGSLSSQQSSSDRVVIKFDMRTGMITGLKRASDGSALNITQKFGQYFAASEGHKPGAYIFRPNSSEPQLFEKPVSFKVYKRQNGGLIEIQQKWNDWIWQTMRVDSRKNYIEFDYVVGPIPIRHHISHKHMGREIVTRYITNLPSDGVFLTDSNARQLLPRRRLYDDNPAQTGGSFYPVVSTLMLRNTLASRSNRSAEAVAILVDRAQAGTSLNNGDLELLIHRRHLSDDDFGVGEALNEPGEDGRGLVTRGKHRLYLKFPDQDAASQSYAAQRRSDTTDTVPQQQAALFEMPRLPRQNLTHEMVQSTTYDINQTEPRPTYLIYDQLYNDIRQESIKYALKPFLTFDRLRVSASEFVQLLHNSESTKTDQTLLNTTLPSNVHLLTLQPWNKESNQLLLRFENLDNPLTVHPFPDGEVYDRLLRSYNTSTPDSDQFPSDDCATRSFRPAEFDVEYLLNNIKIKSLNELNLGANAKLSEDKRLDWTAEVPDSCQPDVTSGTSIRLGPRQIKTFLATFELSSSPKSSYYMK